MYWIVQYLWLIPALPLAAAGLVAVMGQSRRQWASTLAIGSMVLSFCLAIYALITTFGAANEGEVWRKFYSFEWFQFGTSALRLGWVLDPLSASMLAMVTIVSTLIFIFSVGYMAHDDNFTRFFGFLALFAAAMLGLVIANNLLLLFICWELVGLASYLLIGFWFHKPSAAAAAKKAFITTRVGDIGFFIGMIWLYAQTGTLLFYDDGKGCLETGALTQLVAQTSVSGLAVSTLIGLLIFCGAMGKSGQVPLHVWLPDAMEGPTPVSALIHAATMVAAGVFLVARIYPLLDPGTVGVSGSSFALTVIAWVGAITAVFAACIAVAQTDIKRILAYSTVSQLGYMMLALGVGGYVAGMFHLLTHAFFKALLFLGAGSVIHGCHDEQDIRQMGGLKKYMPATFLTYAIGMLALAGFPLLFSGFWSKDEILHQAAIWPVSRWPFYLGVFGAFLTAFYMTRQVCLVFFGEYRGAKVHHTPMASKTKPSKGGPSSHHKGENLPHESPPVMVYPLMVLAAGAILLGFIGTPAWPWFHDYMTGHHSAFDFGRLLDHEILATMALSTLVVAVGIGLGWMLYGRKPIRKADQLDVLETARPEFYALLKNKFLIDELYETTIILWNWVAAQSCDWFDRYIWENVVRLMSLLTLGGAWLSRVFDEYVINLGFDAGCGGVRRSAGLGSRFQNGQTQNYLRVIAVALVVFVLLLAWGGKP